MDDQKEPLVHHELSEHDLEMLHQEYLKNPTSTQLKFNYAWGLVNSTSKQNFASAVNLFSEIYSDSPSRRRECLYLLALGEYKLGNYREAREYLNSLLQVEPQNMQAIELRSKIDSQVQEEGLIGAALVGGAIAVGAGILAAIFSSGKRR